MHCDILDYHQNSMFSIVSCRQEMCAKGPTKFVLLGIFVYECSYLDIIPQIVFMAPTKFAKSLHLVFNHMQKEYVKICNTNM